MTQINDCKFNALRSFGHIGALNDMMLQWAQTNGATANALNDALLQALQANGATAAQLNDAWYEALVTLGISASQINDMQHNFWCTYFGDFGALLYNDARYSVIEELHQGLPAVFDRDDSDATIVDNAGVMHQCLANEVRFPAARRVYNEIVYSEDLSKANTIGFTAISGNDIASLPADGGGVISAETLDAGHDYVISLVMNAVSGTHNVRLRMDGDPATNIDIELTETPKRYVIQKNNCSGGIQYAILNSEVPVAGDIRITAIQAEKVTNKTDKSPSEYVPVRVGTGVEFFDDPEFDVDDTSSGGAGQWAWTATQWEISGGALRHNTTNVETVAAVGFKEGKFYRIRYHLTSTSGGLLAAALGGNPFNAYDPLALNVGFHDFVMPCGTSSDDLVLLSAFGATDLAFEYFRVDEVIDHGSNVPNVKYFPTENHPNRVVDGLVVPDVPQLPIHGLRGYLIEPLSINKCANRNANPTDTTNLSLIDTGSGATLTVVDDSAELEAAGLLEICNLGQAYRLEAGTALAVALINGSSGNTNRHVGTTYARVVGTENINTSIGLNGADARIQGSSYQRHETSAITGTGSELYLTCGVGDVLYFILNQLEETDYEATSAIVTNLVATQRDGDTIINHALNFNQDEGHMLFDLIIFGDVGNNAIISDGGTSQFVVGQSSNFSLIDFTESINSGVTAVPNQPHKVVVSWSVAETTIKISVDGSVPVVKNDWSNFWFTTPSGILHSTSLGIASQLKEMRTSSKFLSDAELQGLSS